MSDRKIKILRVMRGLKFGGIELRTLNLTKALNDSGEYECDIVTILDRGELINQAEAWGINVFHIPIKHRSDLRGIFQLRNIIRQKHYQIVHTHSFYPNVPGRIAAILARAPVIIAHQHSLFGKKCKRIKHKWYEKLLAPFTNRIIAVSRTVKDDYVKFTGISADKIEVIYNGIDLTPFTKTYDIASLKQQIGITDRIIIGSIGRLVGVKNYPTLISAAHKVSQIIPNVVFIIVGDGTSEMKSRLLSQIAELKLENYVKLLGYRTDIPQLVQMFDICVLPSHFEGFPGVILEYMAAQKPIIASNKGGQTEILTPEKNTLFFPPDNADELANSIIKLIQVPKLRQNLAENARIASGDFSLEKMVTNFDRLYKTLLAKK